MTNDYPSTFSLSLSCANFLPKIHCKLHRKRRWVHSVSLSLNPSDAETPLELQTTAKLFDWVHEAGSLGLDSLE